MFTLKHSFFKTVTCSTSCVESVVLMLPWLEVLFLKMCVCGGGGREDKQSHILSSPEKQFGLKC